MKTRDEKGLPEEEFRKLRDEYDKKAEKSGEQVRKIVFAFMGSLTFSFVAITLAGLLIEDFPAIGFVWLMAFPVILSLFLFDPKVEADKKYKYETDQKIILNALQGKIKLDKIKIAAIIVLGAVAVAANIGCWWFVIDIMGEPVLL
jgi:hypothetical protein